MNPKKVVIHGVKKIYQGASGDVVALNGVFFNFFLQRFEVFIIQIFHLLS